VNFDADVAPDDLPSAAADLVDACKLPRIRVIFEATHPERCANPERIGSQFAALRAAGFQVALDDVGERHSSAPLLRTTSPDFVILDGKLLRSAAESSYAREIVADIVASAGRVGARVIAKGIETTDHLAVAQAEGADLFMGYLMGRPRPGGSE
jgi:EAL domain-containing protein (putative c-di-GMP-specific phosphodiesterase class I)